MVHANYVNNKVLKEFHITENEFDSNYESEKLFNETKKHLVILREKLNEDGYPIGYPKSFNQIRKDYQYTPNEIWLMCDFIECNLQGQK